MSERDISQASEEKEKESLESTESKQEARSLEEATHEPGARIEETGTIATAEAIESSIKEMTTSTVSEEGPEQIRPKNIEKELPEASQLEKDLDTGMDIGSELEDVVGGMMDGGPGDIPDGMGGKRGDDDPTGGMLGGMEIPGMGDGGPEDLRDSMKGGRGEPENLPGTDSPFIPGKGPGGGATMMGMADQAWVQEAVEALLEYGSEDDIAEFESMLQESAMDEYELVYDAKPDDDDDDKGSGGSSGTESETPDEGGGGSDVRPPTKAEVDRVMDMLNQASMQDPENPSGGGIGSGGEDRPVITNEYALEKLKNAMELKQQMVHQRMRSGAEVVTDPDSEDPVPPGEDLEAKKGAA